MFRFFVWNDESADHCVSHAGPGNCRTMKKCELCVEFLTVEGTACDGVEDSWWLHLLRALVFLAPEIFGDCLQVHGSRFIRTNKTE